MILLTLACAAAWDILLGEPPAVLHPTVWMGTYIRKFWKIKSRKSPALDFFWGSLLLVSGVVLFTLPWVLLIHISGWNRSLPVLILSIPALKVSFSIRYLLKVAKDIRRCLVKGDLAGARELTGRHLVSRDTSDLTEQEVVSAVVESVAENITDSFTSPVFYFLLLGIPGAWGYRFINTGDAMIAYRNEEFEWGGKLTAWCDSLLNWIPARITGYAIVLATAMVPGFSARESLEVMRSERRKTASPNAGWTMGAMAGALRIRLEKKGEYLLDGGRETLSPDKIDNCLKIAVLSLILTVITIIILIRGGLWVLSTAV